MNKKLAHILILLALIQFGCKEKSKSDSRNLDMEKTDELLSFILSNPADPYTESSCISEKNRLYHVIFTTNLSSFMKTKLGIKNDEHLRIQLELYKNYKLPKSLTFGKKIITEKEFKHFSDLAEKGNHQLFRWLELNCENEYLSVSKPFFNDTFDKAIVTIGTICGGKCGSGETRTYEFRNGKWIIVKTEFEWIS